MDNNQNIINLSQNLLKVKNVLEEMKFKYEFSEKGEIILGLNNKDFFVDVLITDDQELGQIIFYAKQRNLAFSTEIIPAVKDIIADINDDISYGHIIVDISNDLGFAMYKCFLFPNSINEENIRYNLISCLSLGKKYFQEISHFGVIN